MMVDDKQLLEKKANVQVNKIMREVAKLINSIDDLDHTLNKYRGLGVDPLERAFFTSKRFQWPLIHVKGLKMWMKEYKSRFEE